MSGIHPVFFVQLAVLRGQAGQEKHLEACVVDVAFASITRSIN